MEHDLTNSELNKSLKVLTKWNLLIKIYLMLKDNINISLRYDSKNDRKTKGSEALYSFKATSLYSSERRHMLPTDNKSTINTRHFKYCICRSTKLVQSIPSYFSTTTSCRTVPDVRTLRHMSRVTNFTFTP